MQENFANARVMAEKVVEAAGTEFKGAVTGAKIVIGLSESYSGAKGAGKQTLSEAVDLARQLNDPAQLATAQLALAQTMLLAGDSRAASNYALQAEEVFERLGQTASEWQALLITAQASQNLGDKGRARGYAMRAKDSLYKLEQRWGSENYSTYLSRPDIQRFRKQLEQLTGAM
ncbi:MAG TPA: hypothetical protein VGJ66_17215 [Pyrinomonadaceae bacterium]|jgi:hypothetical protein